MGWDVAKMLLGFCFFVFKSSNTDHGQTRLEPYSSTNNEAVRTCCEKKKKKKKKTSSWKTNNTARPKHVVGISLFGLSKSLPFEALLTENTAELPPGYPLCVYEAWVFLSLLTLHLHRICHWRMKNKIIFIIYPEFFGVSKSCVGICVSSLNKV